MPDISQVSPIAGSETPGGSPFNVVGERADGSCVRRLAVIVLGVAAVVAATVFVWLNTGEPEDFGVVLEMGEGSCHNPTITHHGDVWITDENAPASWYGEAVTGKMNTQGEAATFIADDGTTMNYRFFGSMVGGLVMSYSCNIPP
jgi:hypothetical protein